MSAKSYFNPLANRETSQIYFCRLQYLEHLTRAITLLFEGVVFDIQLRYCPNEQFQANLFTHFKFFAQNMDTLWTHKNLIRCSEAFHHRVPPANGYTLPNGY